MIRFTVEFYTSNSATLIIDDGGNFHTLNTYTLRLNGENKGEVSTTVYNLFDLDPSTEYKAELLKDGNVVDTVSFATLSEPISISVKEMGAKGDGVSDDTAFIQAAIMACPKGGRVYFPAGTYKTLPIFLKSDIYVEVCKGAVISAFTDRNRFPVLPAEKVSKDGNDSLYISSWEGNPVPTWASIITGIDAENVVLYGEGTVDGCASKADWWDRPKELKETFRPRMLFLAHCRNVKVQGLLFTNSPSWTLHPYFTDDFAIYGTRVSNPPDAPNTDGFDPESCNGLKVWGIHFSVGDDCIAVKSGKIYMGHKYKTPCENVDISYCLMERGHGAVTLGSEIGAGVRNIRVNRCDFIDTDRGLRLKTRRGRGEDSVIDDVIFSNIKMDGVKTPFVINSFYFCDPDGKTEYVQDRNPLPVDERTPYIKNVLFENCECHNCHFAASYLIGLPERKIESVTFKNVHIDFAKEAEKGFAAMLCGLEETCKMGFSVTNVDRLTMENVTIEGQDGEPYLFENVNKVSVNG
ncbi:MAG: glycoside hydrolase family 28 protein [Lachnospiraceae bacterium]|nr:glycoside hydrolase family 28 protein [Lachnospiraceae bacterium]